MPTKRAVKKPANKPARPKPAGAKAATKAAALKPAKPANPTPTKSAKSKKPVAAPKLPKVAVKPKHASKPSLPLPPPPPPPPAQREEMIAPRDIGRLLRYGEAVGPHKIDVRMLPLQLSSSAALAVCDPTAPKTFRAFDRPVTNGVFRVMLSVARQDNAEQLAAIVVHVGRPPIAKWTVAHHRGQKPPKTADQLPRASTSGWLVLLDAGAGAPAAIEVPAPSGLTPLEVSFPDGRRGLALPCGKGEFAAYWAVDASDKPVCLVVDFDVFSQKDWKAKAGR